MFQFFVTFIIVVYALVALCKWAFKPDLDSEDKLAQANQEIGLLKNELSVYTSQLSKARGELEQSQVEFARLQHLKISADVKLGHKGEVLLPFLHDFPYKDDEIKGMYQPIDLIVFRPDEIIFCEIKTGTSSLSEKQKNIRRIIKEGKVRFEVHRLNEKGVSVK